MTPGPQVKCAGVSGWIGFVFLPCSFWNTIAVSRKPDVPAVAVVVAPKPCDIDCRKSSRPGAAERVETQSPYVDGQR